MVNVNDPAADGPPRACALANVVLSSDDAIYNASRYIEF